MSKTIHASGSRKRSIARATINPGKGRVRVNSLDLDLVSPQIYQMKIKEPLLLAGDIANNIDVTVRVNGGGMNGQAEAARLAIGRALASYDKKLEKVFLNYDRTLLVADVRFKEPSKPNCRGKARAKRQKSYR